MNLSETIVTLTKIVLSEERQEVLIQLIDYIQEKVNLHQEIRLNFICTHNSRRSHLAQIWAQTMAYRFGIKNVYCYSGGTEATAMFPKIVETLNKQGFTIQKLSTTENPIYSIKYDDNQHPIICFSKTFDTVFNPKNQYAAIMTCSSADGACPFILGAESRFVIRYDDPKVFDGTPIMDEKYLERSNQIASEMYFVFSKIKK